MTPTPPPFKVFCKPGPKPDQIYVGWKDPTTFETEFVLTVSVNGSEYVTLDTPVASVTTPQIGAQYGYTTPKLPANLSLRFRVQSRNSRTHQASSFSFPTTDCQTQQLPSHATGCYVGTMSLQGRSNHAGAWAYYDGFPVTQTNTGGRFQLCGALPGQHRVSGKNACYLQADSSMMPIQASGQVVLADTMLYGGDVNNDGTVNLFDLVRVGADYRSSPPTDPDADCTRDGRVDLFDLVLVASNYRMAGPLPWGYQKPASANESAAMHELAPSQHSFEDLVRALDRDARTSSAAEDGMPVVLRERQVAPGTVVVDVLAGGDAPIYGADFALRFDPARVQVVDAVTGKAGIQVKPGSAWTAAGTVVVNEVDGRTGQVRFAASLIHPAAPVVGAVLATITFEHRGADDGRPAYVLTAAQLGDPHGGAIGVRWWGVVERWVGQTWLPYATFDRAGRRCPGEDCER